VPADIAVRRADPAEADLVGELTERVYRGLAAMILCTETRMHAAQSLYERRGYLREAARDWQIRDVRLIAYRLPL
jgi:ribosomal protein S18 acetylase RimI-like enzyme